MKLNEQKSYMKTKLTIACLLLSVGMAIKAEHLLQVVPMTGVENEYVIGQIGKITFDDGVMYLLSHDGTELGSTAVNEINKIIFSEKDEFPTGTEVVNAAGQMRIYSIPSQDAIVVSGIQNAQSARIFSLSGQIIQTVPMQSGKNTISVSGIQNGTYLLQVGAEVVKFIKQ